MRRTASTLFAAISVPLTGIAVLTAHPARLYAEAAPAPPPCTAPEVTTCASEDAGAPCAWDGGSGLCQSGLCANADSGTNVTALRCMPIYETPEPTPEAGPDAAAPEASVADARGAGSDATSGVDATPGGNVGGGGADSTCSCDTVGRSTASDATQASGASAALLFAMAFVARARARQRRARGGGGIS